MAYGEASGTGTDISGGGYEGGNEFDMAVGNLPGSGGYGFGKFDGKWGALDPETGLPTDLSDKGAVKEALAAMRTTSKPGFLNSLISVLGKIAKVKSYTSIPGLIGLSLKKAIDYRDKKAREIQAKTGINFDQAKELANTQVHREMAAIDANVKTGGTPGGGELANIIASVTNATNAGSIDEVEAYFKRNPDAEAAFEKARARNPKWTREAWARANYEERKAADPNAVWGSMEEEGESEEVTEKKDPKTDPWGNFLDMYFGIEPKGEDPGVPSYLDRVLRDVTFKQDEAKEFLDKITQTSGETLASLQPYSDILKQKVETTRPLTLGFGGRPVTSFITRPDREVGNQYKDLTAAIAEIKNQPANTKYALADMLSPEKGYMTYKTDYQDLMKLLLDKYRVEKGLSLEEQKLLLEKYRVEKGLDIDQQRANQGEDKWSWLDFAKDIIGISSSGYDIYKKLFPSAKTDTTGNISFWDLI